MKTQRKNSWKLSLLALALLSFLSCGDKGGSNQTSSAPPIVPSAPPIQTPVAFYAQTPNVRVGNTFNPYSRFVAGPAMAAFLQDAMGICNRAHANGGLAHCNTWARGEFDFVMWAPQGSTSNSLRLIIRAIPGQQWGGYGSYSYSFPSLKEMIICGLTGICINTGNNAPIYNPLVVEGNLWPLNNSMGFQSTAYGPRVSRAYNKTLSVRVESGKLEDASFNFTLLYDNQVMGSGHAVRCQSENCGLDAQLFRL